MTEKREPPLRATILFYIPIAFLITIIAVIILQIMLYNKMESITELQLEMQKQITSIENNK